MARKHPTHVPAKGHAAEKETDVDRNVAGGSDDPVGAPHMSSREDAVRAAAYARYEARRGENGSALDDWLQAEAQIGQMQASVGAATQ